MNRKKKYQEFGMIHRPESKHVIAAVFKLLTFCHGVEKIFRSPRRLIPMCFHKSKIRGAFVAK